MACLDFRYPQVYSNKTPNTAVFPPNTGISINETVPCSFRKLFQAFQPRSKCEETSSIRWNVRIFDIHKCIPIKLQILRFFYRKQGFPLLKPSHIRSERCSKRSSPVPGVKTQALSDGMFRIFDIPKCIPLKPQIQRFFYQTPGYQLLKPSHIRSEWCSKRPSPVHGAKRRDLSDGTFRFLIFPSVFQ